MAILAFAALTTIAAFASYLAGFHAGQREQILLQNAATLRLRKAEIQRDYPDAQYDEWLASVLDDMRVKRERYGAK